MRARFALLLALFLASAPVASAQLRMPQTPRYSLTGTWDVHTIFPGTLTLTENADGTLSGTYVSPVLANNAACRGDYRQGGFVLLCQEPGRQPILFSGAAAPIGFSVEGAPPPQPRMNGHLYPVELSGALATTPVGGPPFTATR